MQIGTQWPFLFREASEWEMTILASSNKYADPGSNFLHIEICVITAYSRVDKLEIRIRQYHMERCCASDGSIKLCFDRQRS